tara:strand:- start:87 stop:290 length:204 start_codon:yes stop_codon:yes gene_type:complete
MARILENKNTTNRVLGKLVIATMARVGKTETKDVVFVGHVDLIGKEWVLAPNAKNAPMPPPIVRYCF